MRLFFILLLLVCCIFVPAQAAEYAVNFEGGAVVVDETGAALVPAGSYDRLYALRNDSGELTGYAAGIETDGVIKYAVLNAGGEIKTDFIYSGIWQAGDGCIVCENGVYRYLSAAHNYDDNSFGALVYAGSGRVIAVTGNAYDDIADPVSILLTYGGIHVSTNISTLNAFEGFSEGLMPLYDADAQLYGYVDQQLSWAISPAYNYAGSFRNGLAIVSNENGFGIIDNTGKIRLATVSYLIIRSDSIFASIRGGALRVYDNELNLISVTALDGAQVKLTGDYIVLSRSDSETVIDAHGTELFSLPAGAGISSAGDGLFIVREGDWATCSVTLRQWDGTILSREFASIYRLDGDRLAYSLPDEDGFVHYGLMANDGSLVTDALYDSLVCVTDGMYCADISTGAVLVDSSGSIMNTFKAAERD